MFELDLMSSFVYSTTKQANNNQQLSPLSKNRIVGTRGNTANVIVTSNLDITLFTPVGRPTVLDDPVVLAILSTPTDKQDSVVDILFSTSAVGIIINTRVVEGECTTSINSQEKHNTEHQR